MRILSAIALFLPLSLASQNAAAAQDITGIWSRGQAYCATNVWIRDEASGEKVGDVLVMNVKPQDNVVLTGSAYDPQRKLNLSASVSVNGDQMTTRGCVLAGMLCKSMNWTRVK